MGNIRDQEESLFSRWRGLRSDLVTDGVVDELAYLASNQKIMFIMKEVNDKGGGNWDLREEILKKGIRPQTWDNVTRWIMGIKSLKKDFDWSELKDITPAQQVEELKSIVVMNLKKSPGGHTTNNAEMGSAAKADKQFLTEQYQLYNPDLVICCGSVICNLFQEYIPLEYTSKWVQTRRGIWFREFNKGKYLISYSHPEARVDHCLLYYGLIDAVREILGSKS